MFLLKWPAFPSPFWFSSKVRGGAVEGEVISENTVKTSIDTLNLIEGELPAIGTKVVIIPGSYHLVGKTEEEIEKEKAEREAALKEYRLKEENERRQREKAVREKAKLANEKLHIPVKWTSGFKSVISGLTENSNCDGTNRRSVIHVLLEEDIHEGSFKRKSGSFLCTTEKGTNGKEWVDLKRTSSDDEGQYVSEVTCKACLKAAKRWNK